MSSKVLRILGFLCIGAFLVINLVQPAVSAQSQGLVHIVPLTGEIDAALPFSIERAFNSAAQRGAEAIILEIDTYGGLVDASNRIKNKIYESPIPVYAYVKNAISGGAFVALACDAIYMHPGSALGAVEPVAGGETITDEKTLSVIDGQMRAMAERHGRDPDIASSMVRKDIAIPNIIDEGRLLTLTATKAQEVGYAEGIVNSYSDIPALVGINATEYVVYSEAWAVQLARFITSSTVASILLTIGMAALAIEIFTAGFGVAGSISLIAFTLFFAGHLIVGFAQWEYIAVFILGIILLMAEVFVSGFGFLGAAGLIFVAFSIILSAEDFTSGLMMLGISFLMSIVVIAISFRFLRKSKLWTRLVLSDSESKERGYVGPKDISALKGVVGIAVTPLRPSGTVHLKDGQRVDAITEGSYIAADTKVIVIGYSSGSVVVIPILEE